VEEEEEEAEECSTSDKNRRVTGLVTFCVGTAL
jgi:hypothetical protein